MKIQCNVCEAAEAKVFCCADEAALCGDCDQKVHAANKLSSMHQRVPLSTSSSQKPKCDICQETVGYFFCLEDRALLCRRCDVSIHTANRLVAAHQRFLLTGVKVGLEAAKFDPPIPSLPVERSLGSNAPPTPKSVMNVATAEQSNKTLPVQASVGGDISLSKLSFTGGSTAESISPWQLDEFLELGDFGQKYDLMDPGSSKADSGRFGDSDYSPILRVADMEVEGDECMGQSPNNFWTVPEIPSPPTASGLNWPMIPQTPCDSAAFVPDIISLPTHNRRSHGGDNLKRRRCF
ncbi:B-box zinc finger protein 22-like [Salvia splendens]|uniref:B-box zinc finger protein 22-like n=1 Tax=Salvia splendens TaxID=180675 RepID=UPI0011034056|nr:B-box zinc finger protein 22-like [Salvia splendens]